MNATAILAVVTVILGLTTAYLSYVYFKLVRDFSSLKESLKSTSRGEEIERQASEKAKEILDEARERAQKIVSDSNKRAQEIISQSTTFGEEQKGAMQKALKEARESQTDQFSQLLSAVRDESMKVLTNLTETIESEALTQVESVKTNIQNQLAAANSKLEETISLGIKQTQDMLANSQQQVIQMMQSERAKLESQTQENIKQMQSIIANSQQQMMQVLESERGKVEAQVEEYKMQRIKKVDEKIVEIIKSVVEDFLGKSISPQEHQKQIIQSLKSAKKENLF